MHSILQSNEFDTNTYVYVKYILLASWDGYSALPQNGPSLKWGNLCPQGQPGRHLAGRWDFDFFVTPSTNTACMGGQFHERRPFRAGFCPKSGIGRDNNTIHRWWLGSQNWFLLAVKKQEWTRSSFSPCHISTKTHMALSWWYAVGDNWLQVAGGNVRERLHE